MTKLITLGEGALWHAEAQRFVFIDIDGCAVHFYTPATQVRVTHVIPASINQPQLVSPQVGTVVATSELNTYMIALQHTTGIMLIDYHTGALTPYAAHAEWSNQDLKLNDGKCSPAGTLWVGSLVQAHKRAELGAAASLYVVRPTDDSRNNNSHSNSTASSLPGTMHHVFGGVTVSNGISFSLDHSTMYYIDTSSLTVVQYNYNKQSDSIDLSSRKVIITCDVAVDGYPDGCVLDAEGMLWVCFWQGSNISRYDPRSGKLLQRIMLPCTCITSAAFCGADMDELMITTASNKVDIRKQPLAGSVFVVRGLGVKGVISPVYNLTRAKSKL